MDLVLNKQQRLICHKTQTNNYQLFVHGYMVTVILIKQQCFVDNHMASIN